MTPTAETPRSPEAVPHQTVPMLVWADIDAGIADMVRYLNTIPGVRTEASCQGGMSYRPQVLTIWPKEQEARLLAEFDIHETNCGECWGYLHPRGGWVAPLAREASKAVAPIDRDESYNRDYIPLPGGWEIQTKGRGSSFRICNTKTNDRILIPHQPYVHEMLEQMARDVHAAWVAYASPAAAGVVTREFAEQLLNEAYNAGTQGIGYGEQVSKLYDAALAEGTK